MGEQLGVDTIIVEADGHTPDTGRVAVTEGRLIVWNLPPTVFVGDSVLVEIHAAVPSGQLRTLAQSTMFDLLLENGLTASDGAQSVRSLTIHAGGWRSHPVWIRATRAGTSSLTVSHLHYRPERKQVEVRAR